MIVFKIMKITRALVSFLPASMQRRLRRYHYARKLHAATLEDESDLRVLPQFVKPGMNALDIGANFGLYTRFLSEQVGESGSVYSFEPISESFAVLENNVEALGLTNVSLFRHALSNRSGTAEMRIPKRTDGSLNHYEASLETEEWEGEYLVDRVEMGTLDDWAEQQCIGKIDFIKCDVEGHELDVFAGGSHLLARDKPTLLFKSHEFQVRKGDLFRLLTELGYDGYFFYVSRADHNSVLKKSHGQLVPCDQEAAYPYIHPDVRHRYYVFVPAGQQP